LAGGFSQDDGAVTAGPAQGDSAAKAAPTTAARTTPLVDAHRRLGAKMAEFGGWLMPINYPPGILEEHHTTRRAVGIFDVCHMGEIHFRGPRAAEAVQRLVTNQVSRLTDGRALYTVACHPSGGIVDDLLVYRLDAQHYLLIVNAANIDKDRRWFVDQVGTWCEIADASDETGLIAVQGPTAERTVAALTSAPLAGLPRFALLADVAVAGKTTTIARTGYTGEDGFEILCRREDAVPLWDALLEAAVRVGDDGAPIGLGARDTLRLEARLSLYGNDLTDDTTPLEAGLDWVVRFDAGDFIGREALLRQRAEGVQRMLVGFVMRGRGIPRHGYALHAPSGEKIGEVTSGGVGPTVNENIGLGYVPAALAQPGARLLVDCRGKMIEAKIVKGPFYRRSPA
jgi:aminomethyltransferase